MKLLQFLTKRSTGTPRPSSSRRTRLQLEQLESRLVPYAVSGNAWPNPQLITLSFEPDGTIVGQNNSGNLISNLFSAFNTKFGSAATWQNVILKAAQTWAAQTNINFTVVSDNGGSIGSGSYEQGDPNMGDIRIGGYNFGSTTLASTYMPPPVNNYSIAGDMQFNTGQTWNIGSQYDLYTVSMHEIGHALGLYHTNIVSADMYQAYHGVMSTLASDDISGDRNIYSGNNARSADSYYSSSPSNNSFTNASNLTSLINGSTLAAQVTYLDITTTTEQEFFSVTAPTGTSGTFTVSAQSAGLSLLTPSLTVYAANQTTVLGTASVSGTNGGTATVTVSGVTAGTQYYLKVAGVDATVFSTGRYALTLNFGSGAMPSVPIPNTQVAQGSPHTSGGGQAIKQSLETQVNTTTAGIQQVGDGNQQAVAVDSYGDSVVVWSSYGQDGSGWGVYGQRYNALNQAVGGEFRVNTWTTGDQDQAVVAMDAAGDFVVAWTSNGQDGSSGGVYAQRYNSLGIAQGGEFRVNSYTTGDQSYPSVGMDSTGNFVVAWMSNGQDGSGYGIYAQRYNAAGLAQGGEFRLNTTTAGDQMYGNMTMNGSGNFVITWSSYGQDTASSWGVYAQRYNASGVAQGGEFRVNSTTAGDQMSSSVAIDPTGDFVISWSSYGQDAASTWGIYAQRYNASGVAQSGEFRVNTTTAGDQDYSAVAMDGNGNFLITWQSYGQDAATTWGVYARQYSANGNAVGTEFQVNTTTAGDQKLPSITMNSVGSAVVVWCGNGAGDADGVYLQRYVLGAGSGLSSNEAAYDTFDPNEGLAEAAAQTGQSPALAANGVASQTVNDQLAALLIQARGSAAVAWSAPGTAVVPFSFSQPAFPAGAAWDQSAGPARAGALASLSRSALVLSTRTASDDCFEDASWLEDALLAIQLDGIPHTPSVEAGSVAVETSDASPAPAAVIDE